MCNAIVDELANKIELKNRYKLKSIHRELVPTNYGMKDGVRLVIMYSTFGLSDIELPIFISLEEPYQPISRSYLESGGILVDSLECFKFNIVDK